MQPVPEKQIRFLTDRYLEKKKTNPQYSLSAFARDLGLSISFLSRLLNGERPLTVKLAIQLTTLLGWEQSQIEELVAAIIKTSSPDAKISKKMRESVASKEKRRTENLTYFAVERFKAISSWYHLAILNLTYTKHFNAAPTEIAKRLGISRIEAEDAIHRLLGLGLLERSGKTLKKTKNTLFIATEKSEPAIREFQFQMIEKAKASLQDTSQEAFDKRCMPGSTLAIDLKKLPLLQERIRKFQLELAELSRSDTYDEVYQLNLQFFPISKPKEKSK